ncbi:MAG TPA: hypothetical protein VL123_01890 [Candidatus Udaeobacter sp.]|nr:hypothetical protein [Candidatus Udaeobacter sp.]
MRSNSLRGASLGALLGYAAAMMAPGLPILHFFPRLGIWRFAPMAGQPAISWYGAVLYGALGGVLGAALCGRMGRAPSWKWICVTAALVLVALAWHERHWFAR